MAVAQSPKTGVPQYEIAPPAGWVQPPPAFGAAYATGANASSGSEYLLVDRQARLDGAASLYSRFVVRPLNPAGVSSESQVSIVFDPEREHLRVHGVTVHRGIETVDELKRGRIEVLQRESGLEQGLLEDELEPRLVRRVDGVDAAQRRRGGEQGIVGVVGDAGQAAGLDVDPAARFADGKVAAQVESGAVAQGISAKALGTGGGDG